MSDEKKSVGRLLIGDFGGAAAEARIKDKAFCMHRFFELDEDARTVKCRECGSLVDAFTVLHDYAKGERLWRHYNDECAKSRKILAELQKQERLAKARTRSASRKDAETAVKAERERMAAKLSSARWRCRQIARMAEEINGMVGGDVALDEMPALPEKAGPDR